VFLRPGQDDPKIDVVERLAIRPGDRLVVHVGHYLTDAEADRLVASVKRAFDKADYKPPILLLEGDMEIGVVGPEAPAPSGVVRQAALEALLSTGFDAFNARAVLGMGPEAGGT
jgi:hypothetical protein